MPGVPKELIERALKVDPKSTPKKQRLRCFSPDKREAIKKELAKLLAVGFIKEVYHPEWLANPVLVQAYGIQRPVYFISEVLSKSKVRYPSIQKVLYGILITSRKF